MTSILRHTRILGQKHNLRKARNALLARMPRESVCAEVGVWKGDFTARILATVRPRRIHLIDPWLFVASPEYTLTWYGGVDAKDQADMDDIYEGVVKRFRREAEDGIVVLHRQRSIQAAAEFSPGYFDWIYIDGDHHYDEVRQDLELFGRVVKIGGYVCGDDYTDTSWWGDSVIRAVDEYVASGQAEVALIEGNQFVLRRT